MTTPMQKWYFDGVNLTTLAWSVAEVPKGIGVPAKQTGNLQVPYTYGDRHKIKRFAPRDLILPMWVKGRDPDTGKVPAGKTEKDALFENMDYLSGVFTTRTERTLRREWPNTTTIREAQAEVVKEVDFQRVIPLLAKFVVEFHLADPFFYGLNQESELESIDASPTTWTHDNPGTAPAIHLTITMTGPLASPKLENLSNGIWLQYNGAILNGESVVFDCKAHTITKGGENYISALKHQGSPFWMILERGGNNMKVTTDEAPAGSVRIKYYPAYS